MDQRDERLFYEFMANFPPHIRPSYKQVFTGGLEAARELDSRVPPVNWEGYYTRKGGTRWFWCRVVAHDQGKAVVRTKTWNYHAHSPRDFEFSKEPEGNHD